MSSELFDELDRLAATGGPRDIARGLIERLEREGPLQLLYDARLLDKRRELGLALSGDLDVDALDAAIRDDLRRAQLEACRDVGRRLLAAGRIAEAWPYFRTIGEPDPVADALERWAELDPQARREHFDGNVEVAFAHGVHPRVGFDVVLADRGPCDAISLLEGGFPFGFELRRHCVSHLLAHMHHELGGALRAEIRGREGSAPETDDLLELVDGRRWLFADGRCHADESHIRAVLRQAIALTAPEDLRRASDLCVYGMQLDGVDAQDPPPFERFYHDYNVLITALAGGRVDEAIAHFRGKLEQQRSRDPRRLRFPAEVLVHLLDATGRTAEAIEVYRAELPNVRRPGLARPIEQMCREIDAFPALRELARGRDDLLEYAAALIESSGKTA